MKPIYSIQTYQPEHKAQWDAFVKTSKNGTFLFQRDFMEYHQDRFQDTSRLIFKDEKLLAVVPANLSDGDMHSHQGLTYGGIVVNADLKFNDYLEVVKTLLKQLEKEGIDTFYLKEMPSFYCNAPSEESSYVLFLLQAVCYRVDLGMTIDYRNSLSFSRTRKRGVSRAQEAGLIIKEETQFDAFWNEVLIPNREEIHQVKPTHTLEEIQLLHSRFPEAIRQFNVYHKDTIVAGATLFITKTTVHVQYAAATDSRQELGSLDLLFHTLIPMFETKQYFSFGISNEQQGMQLNEGLNYWKESFGARSFVHRFYTVQTSNHSLLNAVLI